MNIQNLVDKKFQSNTGWDPLEKLVEECGELIVAVHKHKRWCNDKTRSDLIEEMSDVIFNITGYLKQMDIPVSEMDNIALDKTIKRFPGEL